jgi:hypothetical protein
MWYTIALFVHVLGAIGLFIAVSLVEVALVRMRQAATLEQIREWAFTAQAAGKSIAFISRVLLVPALYMVIVAWGFTIPWVIAALITVIALAIMGATVNARAIEGIVVMAQTAPSGSIPTALRAQLAAPQLWLMEATRLTLLLGVVFLMTMKPGALVSLLTLVSMLILGVALGVVAQRSIVPNIQQEDFA